MRIDVHSADRILHQMCCRACGYVVSGVGAMPMVVMSMIMMLVAMTLVMLMAKMLVRMIVAVILMPAATPVVRPRLLGCQIARRVGFELCATACGTEIERTALMLGPVLCRRRVDVHAAHGALGEMSLRLGRGVIAVALTAVGVPVALVIVCAHDAHA
jgi:hypothetical protein